jgi:hypothetical protein
VHWLLVTGKRDVVSHLSFPLSTTITIRRALDFFLGECDTSGFGYHGTTTRIHDDIHGRRRIAAYMAGTTGDFRPVGLHY